MFIVAGCMRVAKLHLNLDDRIAANMATVTKIIFKVFNVSFSPNKRSFKLKVL
jgi:hypothetical protein